MSGQSTVKQKADGRGGVQSEGNKHAFTMEQVQLIHGLLKARGDVMEIALLHMAVASCLRSGDLLGLKVEKITGPAGLLSRFSVSQEKTGAPVIVTLSAECIAAAKRWIEEGARQPGMRLFPTSREQYARIVKAWARMIQLDPTNYSTHSMRRTQPAHLYKMTGNLKACSRLLGHKSLAHTSNYLGVETEDALKLKEEHRVL